MAAHRGRLSQPADVLVVGAGPTGLALALQAHAHGARVRIVERRAEAFRPSRALIMHARTLEVLRPLGVTDELLARADVAPTAQLHAGSNVIQARLGKFAIPDTAFPHLSLLRQADVEAVLAEALEDRGVPVERGVEMIDLQERADAVHVTLQSAEGIERLDCAFLVGCDGPESAVRTRAGIAWRGRAYPQEAVLADVELTIDLTAEAAHGFITREGLLLVLPLGERATWRLLTLRPAGETVASFGQPGPPVSLTELQTLIRNAGLNASIRTLAWSARYRLQHRLASSFGRGRLYLAGDAAHTYSPATGQGMNTGIHDAANIGWKVAFAAMSTAPAELLDSYDQERRPVAHKLLTLTHLAFAFEASTEPVPTFIRGVLAPLVAPIAPRLLAQQRLVAQGVRLLAQFWVAYPHSPLSVTPMHQQAAGAPAGRRLPDRAVTINGRRVRLHELLAKPGVHVLLQRDAQHIERMLCGRYVHVHRIMDELGSGVFAVRPDGHIGFSAVAADVQQLRTWLARIGAVR